MGGSKVRDAAGMLIEHGRALGALDTARLLADQCTRTASAAREAGEEKLAELMEAHAKSQLEAIPVYERLAVSAKAHAEELMRDIEHPGAVLARRVVATLRSARAAWRGSR
jgi:hypothetical protein